jgi:hypothetical protein
VQENVDAIKKDVQLVKEKIEDVNKLVREEMQSQFAKIRELITGEESN